MEEGPAASTCTAVAQPGWARKYQSGSLPSPVPASTPSVVSRPIWRDLGLVFLLLVLAGTIRVWLIAHTEVAARDGIGFVRYALELESQPWAQVVRKNLQHPGYPILLLLVSWPVRSFLGVTDCLSMQLSAQITAGLAGFLLVIPMYFLGRDLFDRKVGFWGTALFQCLPDSSRVLSDALSEGAFLLFCATALLLAVRMLRNRSVLGSGLCGLVGGMAYLIRPEGALVVAAAGLVLIGVQAYPPWRWTFGRGVASCAALAIGALAAAGPYMVATGGLTNKPTPLRMMQPAQASNLETGAKSQAELAQRAASPGKVPLLASIFAIYDSEAPGPGHDRRLWALQAIGMELAKGYLYVIGVPVLLGMWWFRGCLRVNPGAWVLLVLCLLHMLVLWRLAVVVGYVSDRHVLLLVMCSVFTAAAATSKIGIWAGEWLCRLLKGPSAPAKQVALAGSSLSLVLLLAQTAFGVPESLKPLHLNRAGHRAAGRWLVEHSQLADPIEDPFCWAHFYANRVFWEGKTPPAPAGYQPTRYVVLEQSANDHSRLPMIQEAKGLAAQGKLVYYWPDNKPEAEAKVLVYAVPPQVAKP